MLTESNSGELVTQDPYHRHSGLIGVMAVITRRSRFGLLVLKSDEKCAAAGIISTSVTRLPIRTRVGGLGGLRPNQARLRPLKGSSLRCLIKDYRQTEMLQVKAYQGRMEQPALRIILHAR